MAGRPVGAHRHRTIRIGIVHRHSQTDFKPDVPCCPANDVHALQRCLRRRILDTLIMVHIKVKDHEVESPQGKVFHIAL